MKALTIQQPWASLIAHEFKCYETRSWFTRHMGDILIHAGLGRSPAGEELWAWLKREGWLGVGMLPDCSFDALPRGVILAQVTLVDCCDASRVKLAFSEGSIERHLGDYTRRYAWLLSVRRVFKQPIPARGQQGLWDFRDALPAA